MKAKLINTIILLSLLAVRSFAANDTIVNFRFCKNQIELVSDEGDFYQIAEDKNGYKYIYYLFTDCDYLHLDSTDVKTGDSYYCLPADNDSQSAQWYNSETKKTADSNVKWTLQYEGTHLNNQNSEFVKDNPYKCLHRLSDENPIIVMFNADGNRSKKGDGSSVLLFVMPSLKNHDGKGIQDIKLNYDSLTNRNINDFQNDRKLSKDDTELGNLEFVIQCSDRVIVDSIKANDSIILKTNDNIVCMDEFQPNQKHFVASLSGIPVKYKNNVKLTIYQRYLDNEGKITNKSEEKELPLGWEKTEAPWLPFLITIVAIMFAIVLFEKILKSLFNREESVTQNDAAETDDAQNGDEQPKEKKKAKDAKSQKGKQPKKQGASKSTEELEKELEKKNGLINRINEEITQNKLKLEETNKLLTKAIQNEGKAKLNQQNAEKQTRDAQTKYKGLLAEKKELEGKLKKAEESHQDEIDKINADAEKIISINKQEYKKQLEQWTDDKKNTIGQLISNADRLKNIVGNMNPEAFNGNCGKIISGVNKIFEDLKTASESEAWQTKTTGKCLEEMRDKCCKIIEAGTDSWINLLGRLYSYMSVERMRESLSLENIEFETVSDAFVALQAFMATMGIVVLNCSPGFDSGSDPVTKSLFENKPAIDRITTFLGDSQAVEGAVKNHGCTVYDFGQLAYFTSSNVEIHKGSVIYYNS